MKEKCLMSSFIGLLLLIGLPAFATLPGPPAGEREVIQPPKTDTKPNIDGLLDDKAWTVSPLEKVFVSYNPLYGEPLPQKTLVWLTYDHKNLYFAFLCYDTEPQKIKASITKRDQMFDDDWVGLALDSVGNRQATYSLYVNPYGIQGDILYSAVSGEDRSPDFVWESAGIVTDQGYQVEIRIPLQSINFKSGREVRMGILFRRRISRLSMNGSWPDTKPEQGIFNTLTTVLYKNLKNPLKLEALPSITYGSHQLRVTPEKWGERDTFTEFGIGFKYGLSSSITAEVTINPDFSQVESDAFQVEVNQRYPLFYSEKRPFFMEGADVFGFFTIPNGFLPQAVHTRRIVDPLWGAKLTGTAGKISFGILSAGDEWPGQPWEEGVNPNEGENALLGIARGKHSLGKDNYIGFLYSGRTFAGEYNQVLGADIGYRLFKDHKINVSFLHSNSRNGGAGEDSMDRGDDFNFLYSYNTKPLQVMAAFEHIGRDFSMDSSFLMRRGINHGWIWINPNFYPDPQKVPWLKRVGPELAYKYIYDLNTHMADSELYLSLTFNFIKQGYFWTNYQFIKESWQGQTFGLNRLNLNGGIQLSKWLGLEGQLSLGESIYYMGQPSFKGKGCEGSFSLVIQPNRNLNQRLAFYHSDLSRGAEKLYDVNIYISRTTYQFNKYFFLRAVIQYDTYQKRLLTDLLASFTLIPGTVLHVGYGSLHEGRQWQDGRWLYRQGDLINVKRSLFFKASYLWRF